MFGSKGFFVNFLIKKQKMVAMILFVMILHVPVNIFLVMSGCHQLLKDDLHNP